VLSKVDLISESCPDVILVAFMEREDQRLSMAQLDSNQSHSLLYARCSWHACRSCADYVCACLSLGLIHKEIKRVDLNYCVNSIKQRGKRERDSRVEIDLQVHTSCTITAK